MVFDIGRNTTWGGAANFKLDTYQTYYMTRNSHAFKILGVDALSINSSSNATFAGDVISNGNIKINTGSHLFFDGGTNATYISEDVADRLRFFVGGAEFMRFTESTADTVSIFKDTTFSTQAFATTATSSGDASSTLTTKGYVDGLITGATIYRGTWNPDIALNSGYGSPNLSTVTHTSGYYYICSADGAATPNGTTTEPNTWNTGDWVIWNDDVGVSGEWQKIDNSSVLSGVGTGQTVALWEGAGSVTDSETLGNAPITVSGNNTTFAGTINSGYITSTGLQVDGGIINYQQGDTYADGLQFLRTGATRANIWLNSANNTLNITRSLGTVGMAIDSSGNVGIGTTSPAVNLDILKTGGYGFPVTSGTTQTNGKIRIGSTGTVGILDIGSGSTSQGGWLQSTRSDDLSQGYNLLLNPNGGNVGIGTTSPTVALDFGATVNKAFHLYTSGADIYGFNMKQYDSNGYGVNILSGNGGYIKLRTASGTTTQTTRLTVTPGGNVGIGTVSPTDYGATANTLEVRGASGTGSGLIRVSNADNTVGAAFYSGSASSTLGTQTAHPLYLSTNNSAKMTITSGGKVGIGTTNPQDALDVDWDVEGVATDNSGIRVRAYRPHLNLIDRSSYTTTNGHNFQIKADDAKLQFNATSADNETFDLTRMVIDKDGNVGIGTNSPGAALQVYNGTKLFSNGVLTWGSSADYGTLTWDTGKAIVKGQVGKELHLGANNQNSQLVITSGGNVGIGDTTPSSKLQVAGGIQMADDTDAASAAKVGTMRYRTGTEYVEVDGVELVTNGDFAADTDWTKASGWTISGGTANYDGVASIGDIQQSISFVVGKLYKYTFTISSLTQGGVRVFIGNTVGITHSSNGTFTGYMTYASGSFLILQARSSFVGSIDNVSVVEVTEEAASYADMCMQTGASTYEWVNIVRNTY
jgi:hypothetical protein